jgi:hypothetical protein
MSSNISYTVPKEKIGTDELHFTLEFRFNSGRSEPSTIEGLPRSQVYRFGVDELMGWIDLTEEDAVEVIDGILEQIDEGRSSSIVKFDNGESFRIKRRRNA